MKYEIDIPGLPEGWKAVAFRVPKYGESIIDYSGDLRTVTGLYQQPRLIVEKTRPRRIVLEETDEVRLPKYGEYYVENGQIIMSMGVANGAKKIWRIVEEVERSSTTFRERIINDLVHNRIISEGG